MAKQPNFSEHKIIRAAEANMKAEGFSVTAKAKQDCRAMLTGRITADRLVEQYVTQHRK